MKTISGIPAALFLVVFLAQAACTPTAPTAQKPAVQPTAAKSVESKPDQKSGETKSISSPVSKDLITVKVLLLQSISDAGIYVADAKGFFKDQGIAIEYDRASSGSEMIPLLSTNQIDVGGPSVNAATFNAFIRGVDIKLVADKGSVVKGHGYSAFVLRKDLADSGIVKDFKDLKGLKVGITPPTDGTSNAVDLSNALAKGGLKDDDVTVVNLAYQDMNAALANKSIDVGIENEPAITQAAAQGILVHWKDMDELYPVRQYTSIAYSPGFAKTETAKRFMVAYLRGVRAYNDAFNKGIDKTGVVNILTQYTSLKDAALYDKIVSAWIDPNGAVASDNLRGDLQWFQKKGQVQGEVDISKIIDNSFAEYAVQQLGKYQP